VRVFDSGHFDGDYFMAMEYVDGLDLRRCIAGHGGPLWPSFAATLVADACVGLEYAHRFADASGRALNIVHRDISPDNVMVDGEGQVKLVDFGIARGANTEVTTMTGLRKGKLRYMAPEYLLEHLANPKTDVYSMGLTLFELCTGHKPFEELGTADMLEAILRKGLRNPNEYRPSLPLLLAATILDATAIDPERRLASAKDLETRLRQFLVDYPAPPRAQVGEEVILWRRQLQAGGPRDERVHGQLETTEAFRHAYDPGAPEPSTAAPAEPSVIVAGQLEITGVIDAAAFARATEKTTQADAKSADDDASVILAPELEALAERFRGPGKG
jgi:serine/threonine-protein kinase